MARRSWIVVLAGLVVLAPTGAWAAPGDVDTTFGGGDGVTDDVPVYARSAVVLSDGSSFVSASAGASPAVARYLPDGTLDPAFGDDGIALVDGAEPPRDRVQELAVDSQGRPLVALFVGQPPIPGRHRWHTSLDLVRFTAEGDLDTSFGVGGRVPVTSASRDLLWTEVVIDDHDRPIAVSTVKATGTAPLRLVVRRLTVDGEPDPTFGRNGRVDILPTGRDDLALGATLQPDGRLVVVGDAGAEVGNLTFVLRLWPGGRLDRSFGGDGIVVRRLHERSGWADSVTVAADGDLLLAGGWARRLLVARLQPDGSRDRSFGDAGVAVSDLPSGAEHLHELVEQPDGGLLAAGMRRSSSSFQLLVARFTAAGDLDTAFSDDGWWSVPDGILGGFGIGLVPDDRVLVVGEQHHARLLTT